MFKALALFACVAYANTNADDTTGIFGDAEQWKTGFVTVDKFEDDIFYWMFESRSEPSTDPLVLWLTGGPGCASEVALFYENGPYQFNEDSTLKSNPYSWNQVSNLLYVDQPIGTGFSKGGLHDARSETEVAEDMAQMLRGFVEQNPEFAGRDFYITGESYAGHYVPAISHYLAFTATDVNLNLKGIAIGNGLTDPYEQYPAYAKFSYENGLISKKWDDVMIGGMKACQGLIYESQHQESKKLDVAALEFCQILADSVIGNPLHPKFNVYDIREPCDTPPLCYDFSQSDAFLNREDVQTTLGVTGRKWVECDTLVHTYLLGDWMTNLMPQVAEILDQTQIEVLVYSGDKDWICNWRGGEAWTAATKWSSKQEFNDAEYEKWSVNGTDAGEMRQYGNLHFLRIYEAGHMVPMDQPENALEMVKRFIANDWSLTEEQPSLDIIQ
uniref:Carboxypeptidase n=2 Tax=Choreotrichia TaxID=141411 RepID=A0A7S3I0W3_9SPIT|mmetsp:Transcript_24364/g.30232  ORF Transcript_24364/g.30232 Transcript_24364/m.30232 type:complete len:442 (+) Transcript_24364:16-1341(+)|eukprot:CAMPEP_0170460856 /NCGR_PEP_ID=MMETSP0123-20130129/7021_1 /TAXON_ID=182087 /ORGANISM="Favella ehrenbergii, Strain Fehren 1" /LENGTH=441 /DNA_ID=CAMNT_0010725813 /DNA_START=14 /DNA_END=1339 /DNA_ORIENTATION=+